MAILVNRMILVAVPLAGIAITIALARGPVQDWVHRYLHEHGLR